MTFDEFDDPPGGPTPVQAILILFFVVFLMAAFFHATGAFGR